MRTYKEQPESAHKKGSQYNCAIKKKMRFLYGFLVIASCLIVALAISAFSDLPMGTTNLNPNAALAPGESNVSITDSQSFGSNLDDTSGGSDNSENPDDSETFENLFVSDNLLPPEFIGLPMYNHCLPQEDSMASRMGVGSLIDILGTPRRAVDFWETRPVQAFAFVRVIETVQEENHQISTVEVLRTVWSRGRELPDKMTLTQFSGAIMCCSPYGELMREGGVFLLPLWYNDGTDEWWRQEGWFNWTYFDVLFEVDNTGLIWSRSNLSAFNRFDGRHTSLLTNAILSIANGDENIGRDIAHTPFGWAADDSVLAIVTAVSSESVELFPNSPGRPLWENRYTVIVEEILSTPTVYGLQRGAWFETKLRWRENWRASEQWWQEWEQYREIAALNTSFSMNLLEPGERYLVFITPWYGNFAVPYTFFSESIAKINADGTITPFYDVENIWNVFDEYDGYTVEKLAELAYLANTWHEMSDISCAGNMDLLF